MTKSARDRLLLERAEIRKRLRGLDQEIAELYCEMYKNPEEAFQNTVRTVKAEGNIDDAINKLNDDPFSLGDVVGGRFGKKRVAERIRFKEARKEVIKLLNKIPYTQRELESVERDLAEIEQYEQQEKETTVKSKQQSEKTTKEQELRQTPEEFAQRVKDEERLADERAKAAEQESNKAELDAEREDRKSKMKRDLEKIREAQEMERDDDDLER